MNTNYDYPKAGISRSSLSLGIGPGTYTVIHFIIYFTTPDILRQGFVWLKETSINARYRWSCVILIFRINMKFIAEKDHAKIVVRWLSSTCCSDKPPEPFL